MAYAGTSLGIGNTVVTTVINGLLSMPPLTDEAAQQRSIALYSIYNPNVEVTFPTAVVSFDYGALSPQTGLLQMWGSDDTADDPNAGVDTYGAIFNRSKININVSAVTDADRRFWIDIFILYIIGAYHVQDNGDLIAASFLRYLATNNIIFEGIDAINFQGPSGEERPEGQIFRARLTINCSVQPLWTLTTPSSSSTISATITGETDNGTVTSVNILSI